MLRINTAISYRLKDPGFDSKHGQDILFLKKTHTHTRTSSEANPAS